MSIALTRQERKPHALPFPTDLTPGGAEVTSPRGGLRRNPGLTFCRHWPESVSIAPRATFVAAAAPSASASTASTIAAVTATAPSAPPASGSSAPSFATESTTASTLGGALLPGAGNVDRESASAQFLSVEHFHSGFRFLRCGKFDEREAP